MIRDIFNVCVALVLSARARQIFWRILARHRVAIVVRAAIVVGVLLSFVFRPEGVPVHHEAIAIAPGADGQVLTAGAGGAPAWSGATNGPLPVTNGGTGLLVLSDRSCTFDNATPVWASPMLLPSGTAITLSTTNTNCSVQ